MLCRAAHELTAGWYIVGTSIRENNAFLTIFFSDVSRDRPRRTTTQCAGYIICGPRAYILYYYTLLVLLDMPTPRRFRVVLCAVFMSCDTRLCVRVCARGIIIYNKSLGQCARGIKGRRRRGDTI